MKSKDSKSGAVSIKVKEKPLTKNLNIGTEGMKASVRVQSHELLKT